ncbi:MAG TPA: fibronectin type III domain-containing protein, partial [Burkholderiales bacterium]
MKRLALAAALLAASAAAAPAASNGPRAVATFESLGLYWTPPSDPGAAGCAVQYRKAGDGAWKKGLDLWYDARNRECRGSLVRLSPGTAYEVRLAAPGATTTLTARTWPERFPVARTVTVGGGSETLHITQGGSPDGYVLYTGAPGATIDVANKAANDVTIAAPYVIVRGLV